MGLDPLNSQGNNTQVNVHPYKFPHLRKDEIEKLVHDEHTGYY